MKSLKLHFESLLDDDDVFYDPENDKKGIEEWIKDNYRISGKLSISDDLVVDCTGIVSVKNKAITSLTNGLFRWGKVDGNFTCSFAQITSLEGAPEVVGGSFYCNVCDSLRTLEGAPKEVGWDFDLTNCANLTSLEGAPKKISGSFCCNVCGSLKNLKGAPKEIGRNFDCSACEKLTSLEGAPKEVCKMFDCSNCENLKTLEGAPRVVDGDFYCSNCENLKITDSDRKKNNIRY